MLGLRGARGRPFYKVFASCGGWGGERFQRLLVLYRYTLRCAATQVPPSTTTQPPVPRPHPPESYRIIEFASVECDYRIVETAVFIFVFCFIWPSVLFQMLCLPSSLTAVYLAGIHTAYTAVPFTTAGSQLTRQESGTHQQ